MESRNLQILLVDDDEDQFQIVRKYLKRAQSATYEITWAETCGKALEAISALEFDLCLLDYQLGERTGLELLEDMRGRGFDAPVILLTGRASFQLDIDAMARGVSDFLDKGALTPVLLERSLRYTIENHRIRAELEQVNKKLESSLREIEEDQEAARRIQQQLMPKERLRLDGFTFSYFLNTSARLSGDFVDYFRIDEKHLGVYIADVSGHGVSSAMVTVLLKSTITRLLRQHRLKEDDTILHPDRVLAVLNESILQEDLDKYLTMFYIVVLEEDSRITFSNGGHFPHPILLDQDGARFLDEKNLPVGLFPHAVYSASTLEVPADFAVALFSDGVFEVLEQENLQKKEAHLLAQLNGMDITLESLVERLGLNANDTPIDDVTVLLMKRES